MKTLKSLILSLLCIAVQNTEAMFFSCLNNKDRKSWFSALLGLPPCYSNYHPAFSCCQNIVKGEIRRPDWCAKPTLEQRAIVNTAHLKTVREYFPGGKVYAPRASAPQVYAPHYRRPQSYYQSPVVYAEAWIPRDRRLLFGSFVRSF